MWPAANQPDFSLKDLFRNKWNTQFAYPLWGGPKNSLKLVGFPNRVKVEDMVHFDIFYAIQENVRKFNIMLNSESISRGQNL